MLRLFLPAAVVLLVAAPVAGAAPRARTAAQAEAEQALEEAIDLSHGRGVRTGRELTDALRELALGVRHLRGGERARATVLLSRPDDHGPTLCSDDFCVHGAPSGSLTPKLILAEADTVHAFETGTLGWREPPSDGDERVDIYLEDLGDERLFGYAESETIDETVQGQPAFLVLDDDFDPAQYNGVPALDSLRVTLTHEYGHVLQYGYDVTGDGWHYESSAVWLEQRMYPALDDWLRYVYDGASAPGWRSLTAVPLTAFDDPADTRNAKPYGTAVWNHFLTSRYGARGDELQRGTWEASKGYQLPSTRSYETAIRKVGGTGLASDFAAFAAAVAEWRLPQNGFPLADELPDVERRGVLATDAAPVTTEMDHLTFALYDVPDTSAARIRLAASFPVGTRGAIALVATDGTGAPVTTSLAELPTGGTAGVTLDRPHSFVEAGGRITAVLVNADATQSGYSSKDGDWSWTRDGQRVAAAITSDLTGPSLTSRAPAPGARRVRTRSQVRVVLSESVTGVNAQSFSLRRPNGTAVPAAVTYVAASRTAILTPTTALADTTRHTVKLTSEIVDSTAIGLVPTSWTFTTVKRRPRAALTVVSKDRRAVSFLLRSRDRDRLRWVARLVADNGHTLARRTGALRAGGARAVTVPAKRRARARLVVELWDPQANSTRIVRALRLRR